MNITTIIENAEFLGAYEPGETAVFYSGISVTPAGPIPNWQLANLLAAQYPQHYYTVSTSPAGVYLNQQIEALDLAGTPLTAAEEDQAWEALSAQMAQDAQGPVLACVDGAVNPNGVFATIEYPALLTNKAVTFLNGVTTSTLPQTPAAGISVIGPLSDCYSPFHQSSPVTVPTPSLASSDPALSDSTVPSSGAITSPTVQAESGSGSAGVDWATALGLVGGFGLVVIGAATAQPEIALPGLAILLATPVKSANAGTPQTYSGGSVQYQDNVEVDASLTIAPDIAYAMLASGVADGSLPAADLGEFSAAQSDLSDLRSFLSGETVQLTGQTQLTAEITDTVSAQNLATGGVQVSDLQSNSDGSSIYVAYSSDSAGNEASVEWEITSADGLSQISLYDPYKSNADFTFSDVIQDFQPGDTIDLAGIVATSASIGADNVLTVQETDDTSATLQLDPTQNFTVVDVGAVSDGNGGTDLLLSSLIGVEGGVPSVVDPYNGTVTALGAKDGNLAFYAVGEQAALNGYLYTDGATLDTIDIQTGKVVNSVAFSGSIGPFAADNLTGELVGVDKSEVVEINPTTGVATPITSKISDLAEVALGAVAAVNGFFYAIGASGNLDTVNIQTGTLVSSVPTDAVNFVADNLTGDLVGVHNSTVETIDPATGAEHSITSTISGLHYVQLGGEAAENGYFYAVGVDGYLYTVDISTGQVVSRVTSSSIREYGNFVADQTSGNVSLTSGSATITAGSTLTLNDPNAYPDPISNFVAGTTIDLGGVVATRGRRTAATPVIVRKGALAPNVPHHDLRVTKGHSLFLDGMLIPVEFLINHRSILWDDRAQEVTVYHLELDTHDVLLANGAAAESYRDDGNRWLFQNANSGWDLPPQEPCAPVLTGGPIVDAVWKRLLDRAGLRPGIPLTDDPDLHLLVDGTQLDAGMQSGDFHIFNLSRAPAEVRIISRAAVPQELGLSRDPRCLGVAVRRIVVRQRTRFQKFDANDKRLVEGFHAFEADEDFRWTDGDALLPPEMFAGLTGPIEVVLHIGATTRYVEGVATVRAA